MKHKNAHKKDPAIETLWFLDYQVVKPIPRWVRMPFMKREEANGLINKIDYLNSIYDKLTVEMTDEMIFDEFRFLEVTEKVRVQSEKELDEVIDGLTLRETLFGSDYQYRVDKIKSGEWSVKGFRKGFERYGK